MTDLAQTLVPWSKQRTIALRTRKRNGAMVSTPVSIAVDGNHAYIRTYDASGKAKRLRNLPEVEFAPSTSRGKPTGPWVAARARLLHGEEAERAAQALRRKFPLLHRAVPLYHRLRGWQTLHYELHDISEPNGAGS
ncbi:MAG: PPOX class F420-dependent oxidoreductase [Acidimicrobiales bacterium]